MMEIVRLVVVSAKFSLSKKLWRLKILQMVNQDIPDLFKKQNRIASTKRREVIGRQILKTLENLCWSQILGKEKNQAFKKSPIAQQ